METTLIAAIVGTLATVLAAWIATGKQVSRKQDLSVDIHRQIFDTLYQVRKHFAIIRHHLTEVNPWPTFASDIITATRSFREACDTLQSQVGSNRALIRANVYDRICECVSAGSDLVNGMNIAMSGSIPADLAQAQLSEYLRRFGKRLKDAEEIFNEWRRL